MINLIKKILKIKEKEPTYFIYEDDTITTTKEDVKTNIIKYRYRTDFIKWLIKKELERG